MTTWLILAGAAFLAGVVNAIAGGGSLISFPALLLTGMPSVAANATNTVAIWPGTVSSVLAYRRFIGEERRRATVLAVPSLVGGLIGSIVLIHTPQRVFDAIVPWLILFACALLAAQHRVAALIASRRAADGRGVPWQLWVAQLLISIYGGYFGAGIGILMLAAMGIFLPNALQHANALKVLFSLFINGIAAVYFLGIGAASLPYGAFMAVCALAGGWVGARVAQRLPARVFRGLVIAYGVTVALVMMAK
ncbi:MAG TPA: sulfite exporter TauE/SafE family protein [Anaeromyxobacteraceae bacterium]|nr:sulfite exporter TauE/SafE family protein [Anaeromyxobacteraceae bacterium]